MTTINETSLYIGQRVSVEAGKGTVTGANKTGTYTIVLDSGVILKEQTRDVITVGDSNLHAELAETLALLAAMRAEQAAAQRAYEVEFELWKEQNADVIARRAEAAELADGVDQAARALVSRIYTELDDKAPHAHAAVAIRPTPKLLVEEKEAVKWAITQNRPDALKLNGSQMNALIKAGVAPAEIGGVVNVPVVNIDNDLSDLLPRIAPQVTVNTPAAESTPVVE